MARPPARFFATAARGTEGLLRDELRELGLPAVRATRGGVEFGREMSDAMHACLHSRIAVRVLERLARFEVPDAAALYAGVRQWPFERVLDAGRTLAVRANVQRHPRLNHSAFVGQKVKDAIVDRLRQRDGARPDVDKDDPDVLITLHLVGEQAELLLDVSGTPLHRRGYRLSGGQAPLKESLAAAVLRFAGFDPHYPLVDPMCGSGTFAIEAAQWAQGIPPGLRRSFGFERWRDHDARRAGQWQALREEAQARARQVETPAQVSAFDRDPEAVELTRRHAQRAGVRLRLGSVDFADLRPTHPPALVVINPPYGVRLAQDSVWQDDLREQLRQLAGHRIAVITPDLDLARRLRVRPTREHTLYNGALECRLFVWDVPERFNRREDRRPRRRR